jgi:NADPH:quinone reductase-like Zn-dependent oxidoreductase
MESKKKMRAAVIHEYGGNGIFKNEEIAVPEPASDEVLVKVHYASVNPMDYKLRAGYMKAFIPLKMPAVLGIDLCGTVETTGSAAKKFKTGDLVFGRADFTKSGSYAEFAIAKEGQLAHAPKNASEKEAAALPVTAGTAFGVLFDVAELKPGQKVLITGASGGVGQMAIQLAKNAGAHVIGTTSTANLKLIKDLGADEAIDYTDGDFSGRVKDADIVFDTVGGDTLDKAYKTVKKGGILVSIAGQVDDSIAKKYGIRAKYLSVPSDSQTFEKLAKLVDSGKLRVIIDKEMPLEMIAEAHALSESRKAKGKIIIKI